MLFNSLPFAVFFGVVYALYLATMPRVRLQNRLLLAASVVFYSWWSVRYLAVLFLTIAIDYLAGRAIDRRAGGFPPGADAPYAHSPRARRALLSLSIASNLGVLALFKYAGFLLASLGSLLDALGVAAPLPTLQLILPLGISFYTFVSMSYTIDVYRGRLPAERSFLDFALYVTFFAHLVAGPIVRAVDLLPQIHRRRVLDPEQRADGGWLIAWGLFKKVVIADNLSRLALVGFTDHPLNGGVALAGLYAFAVQIYCDFSGYTDIARGLAKLMGFEFVLNFRLPYLATGMRDFWSRWHISLSTWLRDYLYVPLGGNRKGPRRTAINLLLTMALGGLWHGASWTFVVWGIYHGLLLAGERLWRARIAPAGPAGSVAWTWVRRFVTFHLVCFGWLLFRAASLAQAGGMLAAIATRFSLAGAGFATLLLYSAPLIAMHVLQHRTGDLMAIRRLHWAGRAAIHVGLWFGLTILGNLGGEEFIYFQF